VGEIHPTRETARYRYFCDPTLGNCGSCYAVAAMSMLEARLAK